MDLAALHALLGADAALLDAPLPSGLERPPAARLGGPDYVDRVWGEAAPNAAWLRGLQALFSAGRLGGTGWLVLLAASGNPPADALLAEEGGCSGLLLSDRALDAVGRRYAHRVPLIARVAPEPDVAAQARALRLAGAVGVSLLARPGALALAQAAQAEGLVVLAALGFPDAVPGAPGAESRTPAFAAAFPTAPLVWRPRAIDFDHPQDQPAENAAEALAATFAAIAAFPAARRPGALVGAPITHRRTALAASVLGKRAGALGIVIEHTPGRAAEIDVATLHAVQDVWDAAGIGLG